MRYLFFATVISLAISSAAMGQTTKFNRSGDLISIGGMLTSSTDCEPSRTFTGRITKMEPIRGENSDTFEFTLKPTIGGTMIVLATIPHDQGAIVVDLENMLQPKRRVKVKARQCGSGGYWSPQQIWRIG